MEKKKETIRSAGTRYETSLFWPPVLTRRMLGLGVRVFGLEDWVVPRTTMKLCSENMISNGVDGSNCSDRFRVKGRDEGEETGESGISHRTKFALDFLGL